MLNVETPVVIDMSVQSHPLCLSTKTKPSKDLSTFMSKSKNFTNNQFLEQKNEIRSKIELSAQKCHKRRNLETEEYRKKVLKLNSHGEIERFDLANKIGETSRMSPSLKSFSSDVNMVSTPMSPTEDPKMTNNAGIVPKLVRQNFDINLLN